VQAYDPPPAVGEVPPGATGNGSGASVTSAAVPPLQPGEPGHGGGDEEDPATEDHDLDDVGFRAPLPPEDRIWRHPSELGPAPAATLVRRGPRPAVLVAGAAAAGALLVGGAVVALDTGGGPRVVRAAPATSASVVEIPAVAAVRPAWLGVHGTDASQPAGALVGRLTVDGPGHRAGLQPGDVVAAVDGRPTATMHDLVVRLRTHEPGDEVVLTVHRAGAWLDLRVRLEPWPPGAGDGSAGG